MRGVVFDAMESRANTIRRYLERRCEVFVNSGKALHHAGPVESESGHAQSVAQFRPQARPRIARDGDVMEGHINQPKRASGAGIAAGLAALRYAVQLATR